MIKKKTNIAVRIGICDCIHRQESTMRVVKEAEERRNEILDAADMLFADKGFDNTSTNDILEKVGIARGTLYYHFKSKRIFWMP